MSRFILAPEYHPLGHGFDNAPSCVPIRTKGESGMRHSRSLGKVRPAERRRRLRRLHVEGKKYEHGVDSRRKERVPRGEVATYVWKNSRGRKSTTVYDGEIRGDTIVGWVELDFSGDFVDVAWKASRVVEAER